MPNNLIISLFFILASKEDTVTSHPRTTFLSYCTPSQNQSKVVMSSQHLVVIRYLNEYRVNVTILPRTMRKVNRGLRSIKCCWHSIVRN